MIELAGLNRPASSRYPSGGSIGAIVGSCIEDNRRAWGSLTIRVEAHSGSDYHAIGAL